MGKAASKLKGMVARPVKNYNVESRAFKVISQDKPTPAPTYPSLEKVMRDIKNDPDLLNKGKLTPEQIKNLSQVYVTSTGDNPVLKTKQKLPEDRGTYENVYGFQESVVIPPGKVSLRQLLALLQKHEQDKSKYTAKVLAEEYKLEVKMTENLLEYFRTFRVQADKSHPGALERAKNFVTMAAKEPFIKSPPPRAPRISSKEKSKT